MTMRGGGTGISAAFAVGAACTLGLVAVTAKASADDGGTSRPVASIDDLPPWSLRLSAGGGLPVPNVQHDLLAEEGYGGLRWVFSCSIERRVHGSLGAGVMALTGFRNATAGLREEANTFKVGATPPTYSERFSIVAFELPISLLAARPPHAVWFELELVPWLGAGWGAAWLYEPGEWRGAPAFGATVRALGRGRHGGVGLALGAYSLSVPQPSAAAGPVNFGTLSLSLVGGLDAG